MEGYETQGWRVVRGLALGQCWWVEWMNFFSFIIFIFLWEIMSVDRKEALNIVAGLFAWQRLIILDITVAGAREGWGGWGWGSLMKILMTLKPKIYKNQNIQVRDSEGGILSYQLGNFQMNPVTETTGNNLLDFQPFDWFLLQFFATIHSGDWVYTLANASERQADQLTLTLGDWVDIWTQTGQKQQGPTNTYGTDDSRSVSDPSVWTPTFWTLRALSLTLFFLYGWKRTQIKAQTCHLNVMTRLVFHIECAP